MDIKANDVDIVESGGMLDGEEVKLIRLRGGFWMGIYKGKVVTGGSHPAIVKHTMTKMFPNFQPAMCKSETSSDALVEQHSHFLSDDLRKSGHDVYSIQTGNEIQFQLTKQNLKLASIDATLINDSLFIPELNIPRKYTQAMAGAATEKALSCNAKTIKVK
jgi:hypothetical protein